MKSKKRYFRLMVVTAVVVLLAGIGFAGDLNPPDPDPGPTMKTLDEIPPSWHQILPAADRFVDVMSGEAVLDKETGLVWAKNANLDGGKDWQSALYYCRHIEIGNRKGWRLPTAEELATLINMSLPMPRVHTEAFDNVQTEFYWTTTHDDWDDVSAWYVDMNTGAVSMSSKDNSHYIWPVRGSVCGNTR